MPGEDELGNAATAAAPPAARDDDDDALGHAVRDDDALGLAVTAPPPAARADLALAHAATAPTTSPGTTLTAAPPTAAARAHPGALGRYVIERELGAGGMGVVYAAWDPDLQRRVALKVLREGIASEAEQRLLREARAMARLTHPNVVTVYEVGTADGRDFVAMELVDGAPLVDWLRAERRGEPAILDAFLAAGRGLAAAHAAGIVHRDFKPHNVLRSAHGRIAVTDFGLAREATAALAASSAPSVASLATPDSLSGLTVPGSLLGTPAYMAPEQWAGATVTPATDQFAFCVALWEALAGERPFCGASLEELRAQIERGPDELDASAIPRRLRAPLRRGLATDPAARWPSLEPLLRAIQPRRRRASWIVGGVVAAATALAVAAALPDERAPAVAACEAPALEPDAAWPAADAALIHQRSPRAAQLFTSAIAAWRAQRAASCQQPDAVRRHQLACLDRVLVRIDALRRARLLAPDVAPEGMLRQLYPAETCLLEPPPAMPARYSDAAVVGLALRSGARLPADVVTRAKQEADGDPCAAAYLGIVEFGRTRAARAIEAARQAAQLCGDEQAYAAVTLNRLVHAANTFLSPELPALVREAERSVARAGQPLIRMQLRLAQGQLAESANRLDEAIAHFEAAAREPIDVGDRLQLAQRRLAVLLARGRAADLAQIRHEVPGWIAANIVAFGADRVSPAFAWLDGVAQWRLGDVEAGGARARTAALQYARRPDPTGTLTGVVVGPDGRPVAGAAVAAGARAGDASSLWFPRDPPWADAPVVSTRTDAAGAFSLAGVTAGTLVVAGHAAQRSLATPARDGMRVRLIATGELRGRIDLAAEPHAAMRVAVVPAAGDDGYAWLAPILADGTFALAGVPVGPARVQVERIEGSAEVRGPARTVAVGTPAALAVTVAAPSARSVWVIVRPQTSTPLDGALVHTFARTPRGRTVGELARSGAPLGEDLARAPVDDLPPEVRGQLRPGDVVARITGVPRDGAVCAAGIQVAARDAAFWEQLAARGDSLEARCQRVAADAATVVVEVPPMARLD